MRHTEQADTLTVWLEGRVDSSNVCDVDRELNALVDASPATKLVLDCSELSYVSSPGLRMLIRLHKRYPNLLLSNVVPNVYEVLEMTGIVEILPVRKRMRETSVEGLRMIGEGAFGRVYRLDDERVIKVYHPRVTPLAKIERERESAREAFVRGIPSAIPFEIVRVGDKYGIIYELIDAQTLGEAVMAEPKRVDEYAARMARLLLKLHSTHFERDQLPDARVIFYKWIGIAEKSGLYAPETIDALGQAVIDLGEADTFVHGDFHPANIMVMPDGDPLLIDMGDASMGSPCIDLAGTFHVLRIAALRPGGAERLVGMSLELLDRLWATFVRTYFGTQDDAEIEAIERRLRILAMPRTMGSVARTKLLDDEERTRQARELERAFWESRADQ